MLIINRLEIINKHKDLHKFISDLFNDLDRESLALLKKTKFINNVVKKTTDLGVCYPTKKNYKTLYYSFAYTFFEDIEDKYGGRDNDVILLLSINFYNEKYFVISREIGTLKDDIEYNNSDRLFALENNVKKEILLMKNDFLNYLTEIIVEYKK